MADGRTEQADGTASSEPEGDLSAGVGLSSTWVGYWTESGRPVRHWMKMTLAMEMGGVIGGAGEDGAGRFSVDGICSDDEARWLLRKQYDAGHTVQYHAFRDQDGQGMTGSWWLMGRTGTFCLWPADEAT